MADVFMYADETGNLDYGDHNGSSQHFGVGTVVFAVLSDTELLRAHQAGHAAITAGDYLDADQLQAAMRHAGRLHGE